MLACMADELQPSIHPLCKYIVYSKNQLFFKALTQVARRGLQHFAIGMF